MANASTTGLDNAPQLLLIGGGKMGEALLGGLLRDGWAAPEHLAVVEALSARRIELAERYPGVRIVDAPVAAAGAVIAVKPGDVRSAAAALRQVGVGRVVSIAAGVTIATLQEALGTAVAIVRAMPNTPALVGAGCTGIAAGTSATADDVAWAIGVLGAVGTVVEVSEPLIDAVTGLTGSGPAYLFMMAEALVDAGVLVGLPRALALDMVRQLFVGSAAMLAAGIGTPEELRAQVTSPGGTTIAGLRELERAGLRAAFLDAVASATARSRELGA
ncbi:MAG: pyrroline-5-carboxylate reductase [Acidimicrobiia bacterium]